MFYRLYVTEFETSDGLKIYGGKRHSDKSNPKLDSYVGSGTYISNAKKKYGRSCIKQVLWSKDFGNPELLKEAEELLVDILKEDFVQCVNLVKGGQGGPSYYNPKDNPNIGKTRSIESRKRMSEAAKSREWTEEGLKRRKESTALMWTCVKHPDFTGSKNPAARAVRVGEMVFSTGKECAEYFGIVKSAVINRIKNDKPKWKEWSYVDI